MAKAITSLACRECKTSSTSLSLSSLILTWNGSLRCKITWGMRNRVKRKKIKERERVLESGGLIEARRGRWCEWEFTCLERRIIGSLNFGGGEGCSCSWPHDFYPLLVHVDNPALQVPRSSLLLCLGESKIEKIESLQGEIGQQQLILLQILPIHSPQSY